MSRQFLDFEQPIAELEAKIEELRMMSSDSGVNLHEEIRRLDKHAQELTGRIFSKLNDWQIVQMARHPLRPRAQFYFDKLFTDYDELHGDRQFSQGMAIIGGVARFEDKPVVVLGHEKGIKTKEKLQRNFGMAYPSDYRKALRLMQLAEKFKMPIFTFIDTPGAYPGISAEEQNQSEAIARNLFVMSQLKTPIIATVIGEGGSGGALAIGVADRVMMLQYSIYSVISPEGCASILWKSAEKAPEAAQAMGVTAGRLKSFNLIDAVIEEPLGGAHRDEAKLITNLRTALSEQFRILTSLPLDKLLDQRYKRLMSFGQAG